MPRGVLNAAELLQKEPETRYNEAESHQGQTRANPCEKSSLGCQVIAKLGPEPHFRWRIHFATPRRGRDDQCTRKSLVAIPAMPPRSRPTQL
jgi:hypothetical protein